MTILMLTCVVIGLPIGFMLYARFKPAARDSYVCDPELSELTVRVHPVQSSRQS